MRRRSLALSITFGAAAMTIRNLNVFIPVYGPFKLDLRWIFSLLGASITGPWGGLICGTLAALKPGAQIDLIGSPLPHLFVGLAGSRLGDKFPWAVWIWPMTGVPTYLFATWVFTPTLLGLALLPVLVFIGVSSAAVTFLVVLGLKRRLRTISGFGDVRSSSEKTRS